jgi:hypothetical protein
MTGKITAAIWIACVAATSAGEPAAAPPLSAEIKLPNVDVARTAFTYVDDMDFDDLDGGLSITEFDFISALSRPITVAGDIKLLPFLQYGWTGLDFDGTDAVFPIGDEDLHELSLHLAAVKTNQGSPWLYGGWARAELASDFQHIDGDDLTFDIAGGVGYRFSDSFTLAAGTVALNLNGDVWFCPGINFDWVVNDATRIGIYGPMTLVTYAPCEDWKFSLRGMPGGGTWNITDDHGDSMSIDLSSYRVGAFASRRLAGKLWLTAGAGVTVFNNIEYSDPDGDDEVLDEDLESGFFGQIGLSLKAW